jgi:predicted ribonuclease toxin of YeeF-YezG toxin-antitoxin module
LSSGPSSFNQAKDYKELKNQMINLRKALEAVADFHDNEFQGAKTFYHDHVSVTDQ